MWHQKISVLLLSVAACSASTLSFGGSDLSSPKSLLAGAYAGIGLGVGGIDTPALSHKTLTSYPGSFDKVHDWDTWVYHAHIGYAWVSNPLSYGIELGFIDPPKNEYTIEQETGTDCYQYSSFAVDLLGVAEYAFESGIFINGKVGGAYTRQKFERQNTIDPDFEYKESKILPEVAVGIGYALNGFQLSADYKHIFGKSPKEYSAAKNDGQLYDDHVASIDAAMLTLSYRVH